MKIVHVVYSLKYGGIETMLVNIVNEQIETDNNIYIFIINDVIDDSLINAIDNRVVIVRINRPVGSKNPYYIIRSNLKLFLLKADVIHFHFSQVGQILYLPLFKRRSIYTQHALVDPAEVHYFKNFRIITAISNGVAKSLEKYGIHSCVIYNGIKPNNFCRRQCLNHKISRIVAIGRLTCSVKGQDVLIHAIKKIVNDGDHSIHLDIIGEGESRDYLEGLIKQEGLIENVTILGTKSQKYIENNLYKYDLLVQPSRQEGFGLTITEAMAAQVPVLTSDQLGPMEIIEYGKYGFYFKTGDAKDCAQKIQHIRNANIEDIVIEAFKRIVDKFNVEKTSKEYIKIYQMI